MNYVLSALALLWCAIPLAAKDAPYKNSLTKAFFHKSQISDKVVCYFNKEPLCNHMPQAKTNDLETDAQAIRQGHMKETRFFMPLTEIVDEAQVAIPKINTIAHEHYRIAFKHVEKPLAGVQVQIAYDPRYIGFEFETFDAIHTHKGVVFKFHHKQTLHELHKKTDHILKYASHTKKVPTIIIDNGHGGEDTGKVGYFDVKEKDINLQVGNHLARLLKKKGYNVVFTRTADVFVPLDVRTTLANNLKADLFVSIHANGAKTETASGIETHWAPAALFKKELFDGDAQSMKLIANVLERRDRASKKLAMNVHASVLGQAKKFYNVKDRNIKESVSQVLLGTDMPAALIELGFLSNKEETTFLMQPAYQQAVAQGICTGIESFLKEV